MVAEVTKINKNSRQKEFSVLSFLSLDTHTTQAKTRAPRNIDLRYDRDHILQKSFTLNFIALRALVAACAANAQGVAMILERCS